MVAGRVVLGSRPVRFLDLALVAIAVGWPTVSYAEA